MERDYAPYKTIRNGGFGLTDIIPRGRKPDTVKRVSDTEVYAIYSDLDDTKIKYKQTFKATKVSDTERNNIVEKIEKSTDSGTTWKVLYNG